MSIRSKRIEDDKNKKWASIRFQKFKSSCSSFPFFEGKERSGATVRGWINNGTTYPAGRVDRNRGESLDDTLFKKATDTTWGNIEYLAYYYYFNMTITATLTSDIFTYNEELNPLCAQMSYFITNAIFDYIINDNPTQTIEYILKNYNTDIYNKINNYLTERINNYPVEFTQKIFYFTYSSMCLQAIFQVGLIPETDKPLHRFKEIWNDFVDKAQTDMNRVNTEGYYDADGNWHWKWSSFTLAFELQNMSDYYLSTLSHTKIYQNHKLLKGKFLNLNSYVKSYNLDWSTKYYETLYEA